MAEKSFRQALDETFGKVAEAVQRIQAIQNAETELYNLRAYIINALDLAGEDKRLAEAGDELYRVAAEFVGEVEIEIISGMILHAMGLVPLIRGGEVVAITAERATICTPRGGQLTYLRRSRRDAIVIWELMDDR